MIRVLRISQKLPGRQLLHTYKARELDEPAYYKKSVDPHILSLVKKHEPDIFYSSHIELNKKSLTFKQRKELAISLYLDEYNERLNEARESERSIVVEKLVEYSKSKSQSKGVTDDEASNTENPSQKEVQIELSQEEKRGLAESKLKILTEMGLRRSAIEHEMQSFPDNWMQDYETFDENEMLIDSQYGTPDPNVPISKIPCHGCGALLQCNDSSIPGYLPSELMSGHDNYTLKKLNCQRCHFLKKYNTALKVQVSPEDYVNMISKIKDEKALAILMVDLTDFPCSIWPNIIDIIGDTRPLIVVGNKVDLLPQDSKEYLNHILKCLHNGIIEFGLTAANIKHTCLISSKTHYGIEDLITHLHAIWHDQGDVYLIGNANVGKSTLFNALLQSDYCKIRARDLIQRATSSLWPGTTLRMLKFPIARSSQALLHLRRKRLTNEQRQQYELEKLRRKQVKTGRDPEKTLMEHLGQTFEYIQESKIESEVNLTDAPSMEKHFNENSKTFKDSKWLFDTPGVIQNEQTINMLTCEELIYTIPKQTLWPRVFYVLPGQTLFLAGLGRVDYIGGAKEMRMAVFASDKLSILIVNTEKADAIYEEFLGTEVINVPRGDSNRIKSWPKLQRKEEKISVGNYSNCFDTSACDIVLSSAGWVSVNFPPTETAHFYAWTPEGRGIFVRKPSMLPYAGSLYRGKRKQYTPAYLQKEPKQVRH